MQVSVRTLLTFLAGYLTAKVNNVFLELSPCSTEFKAKPPKQPTIKKEEVLSNQASSTILIQECCDPTHVPEKYKDMFSQTVDVYTPFHEFFANFHRKTCNECPLADKWLPYFEAYHDRFQRYRGKKVLFLEIGVQSGGSIAMWRQYFGDGLHYIGLDINPETQRFDGADWIDIHIGDTGNPEFLKQIRSLYPNGVDVVLDDGGHTMQQQLSNFQIMTDFVKPNGILACEDLATSWGKHFGGVPFGNALNKEFLSKTMVGRIHHAIDWLHAGFHNGNVVAQLETSDERPQDLYPQFLEYKTFLRDFKSIHVFNQIVFFERGTYDQRRIMTKGVKIPYTAVNYSGFKLQWENVLTEMKDIILMDKLNCTV